MAWPKTLIFPDGLQVEVDSWDEIREARETLGAPFIAAGASETATSGEIVSPSRRPLGVGVSTSLAAHDRSLLEQFIEAGSRGVLTQTLGQALGAKGKGIRPALERWSRKINLVTGENAVAFEAVKRYDGRGYRMLDHAIRTANQLLGRQGGKTQQEAL